MGQNTWLSSFTHQNDTAFAGSIFFHIVIISGAQKRKNVGEDGVQVLVRDVQVVRDDRAEGSCNDLRNHPILQFPPSSEAAGWCAKLRTMKISYQKMDVAKAASGAPYRSFLRVLPDYRPYMPARALPRRVFRDILPPPEARSHIWRCLHHLDRSRTGSSAPRHSRRAV
ncbi:hypothetical protein E3N88_29807 [Mikania micrantha]|uniref:Uncharacterized protein n=1 Tax=Mikania micrantha TaxID=192012 RepID=A0A5N6MMR0_9ASTR|nr:hypothetical protein E3N88_29807 [Mikania micrantha]